MTLLQHHIVAFYLTGITVFALGLLVFLAEPKRRLNQIFGLYSFTIFWWAITEACVFTAPNQQAANFWSYIEWPMVFLIPPLFVHTVFLATQRYEKSAKIALRIAYVSGFIFVLLHLFTGLVTAPPRPVAYTPFGNKVTVLGPVVTLTFLVLVQFGLWTLWRAYRQATGQLKTQLKHLFWASVIGYFGGSANWFLSYGFHVPFLNPFGIYGVACYSVAMTYAVLHHRLFDVHVVIRKSLVYSILITLLTVGYFGIIYLAEWAFQTTIGYQSVGISMVAFATMAVVFQPLRARIQRMVERLFFGASREELVKRLEQLEEQVRQAEKLRAIAILAAGMAHEIKNPLTAIKTFTEYFPEKVGDAVFRKKFHRILTMEVQKIELIVRRLLDFSKPAKLQLQPLRLSEVLHDTLELLSHECLRRGITIERSYDSEEVIAGDPQQLRQAFLNLLLNSLEAMDRGGVLTVSMIEDEGRLRVTIEDTGKGISKSDLQRIWEPLFTTKANGTGLGLSIVRDIVKDHGGTIVFDSHLGLGTRCTLRFPRSSAAQQATLCSQTFQKEDA